MILNRWLPEECYDTDILSPDGILIHFISAKYTDPQHPYDPESVFNIFVDLRLSAHYLVLRTGEIWRLMPESNQAWHAGKSAFRGQQGLNKTWFGIEFIGDGETDFTDNQYREGGFLVNDLIHRYRIQTNRVKGHEQVSGANVRPDPKYDPGPCFDWLKFGATVGIEAW